MKGLSTALRGFTQESARHAIQSNTVKYLAEIRFVTTIFINIYGLEEQLKRGGGYLLQQTMDLGVGSLLKFGGVLRQFVVDDKGCVMIGAFGLPQYRYAPIAQQQENSQLLPSSSDGYSPVSPRANRLPFRVTAESQL